METQSLRKKTHDITGVSKAIALRAATDGVTDLSQYSVILGAELLPDIILYD